MLFILLCGGVDCFTLSFLHGSLFIGDIELQRCLEKRNWSQNWSAAWWGCPDYSMLSLTNTKKGFKRFANFLTQSSTWFKISVIDMFYMGCICHHIWSKGQYTGLCRAAYLKQESLGFRSQRRVVLHGICVFSLCIHWFSLDTPTSSQSPLT